MKKTGREEKTTGELGKGKAEMRWNSENKYPGLRFFFFPGWLEGCVSRVGVGLLPM